MIYLTILLHLYQPKVPEIQSRKVFKKILEECYYPVSEILKENGNYTLNLHSTITEALYEGNSEIERKTLKNLEKAYENNNIDFTKTPKYHLIPDLYPEKWTLLQTNLNEMDNKKMLGINEIIKVFRSPEEFSSIKIGKIAKMSGSNFLIVSSFGKPFFTNNEFPIGIDERGKELVRLLFRDDLNSNKIAFKKISAKGLLENLRKTFSDAYKNYEDIYSLITLDGETFGHHKKFYYKFLQDLSKYSKMYEGLRLVKLSELIKINTFFQNRKMKIPENSWAGEKESWTDYENKKVREYLRFVKAKVRTVEESRDKPFYQSLLFEIQPSTSSCGEWHLSGKYTSSPSIQISKNLVKYAVKVLKKYRLEEKFIEYLIFD